MNAACTQALEDLKRALEDDSGLDPEAIAHLEGCPTCRASLGAALKGLEIPDEPPPATDSAAAETEVRARHRRSQLQRGLALCAVLAAASFGVLSYWGGIQDGALLVGVLLLVLVALIPIAFWVVRTPARIGLYKRLCAGRQLSGVCLGLAEWTHTPVGYWRLVFVLLTLLPPAAFGLGLYVVLDLAMPVHPDDRPQLIRFRLARWWRGLRTRTA
jgi:phage shock protein PspC (stress-responsive transcriptional regulator)